ncbi:hypothetical protein FW774_00835 (plasmid) [Pedobacter sp. BS3]|uniref:LptE family protein n=1 Tax=Pedobacter sp. BS3 TaxID=2567937 RepID=UPI0011EFBEAF|nr:LptE family protein [Pedobacter sp. BS3]TZF85655.1 hypothetical protein FW774_00835 [Pedobacter sp. BS3]
MNIAIKKTYGFFLLPLLLLTQSCGIYSFTGASIPPEMKTVSVQFFENNAPLVVPSLSQDFTEALKERVRNQTSLSMVRTDADANFEGRITDYSIKPTAITGNSIAAQNRLTITVSVKFTNTVKPELSFEQSFSRFKDFSLSNGSIESQQNGLIRDINQMLTEDIFNRAFANW